MESAVLLEAVQIGAQGCLGKVLFPQTRGELGHVLGRMLTDPLQDVYEIIVGIDPLQAAGTEQTLDDTEMLCTKFSPAEGNRSLSGVLPPSIGMRQDGLLPGRD